MQNKISLGSEKEKKQILSSSIWGRRGTLEGNSWCICLRNITYLDFAIRFPCLHDKNSLKKKKWKRQPLPSTKAPNGFRLWLLFVCLVWDWEPPSWFCAQGTDTERKYQSQIGLVQGKSPTWCSIFSGFPWLLKYPSLWKIFKT